MSGKWKLVIIPIIYVLFAYGMRIKPLVLGPYNMPYFAPEFFFRIPTKVTITLPENKANPLNNSSFSLFSGYQNAYLAASQDLDARHNIGHGTSICELFEYSRNLMETISIVPLFIPATIEKALPWLYGQDMYNPDSTHGLRRENWIPYKPLGLIALIALLLTILTSNLFIYPYLLYCLWAFIYGRLYWWGYSADLNYSIQDIFSYLIFCRENIFFLSLSILFLLYLLFRIYLWLTGKNIRDLLSPELNEDKKMQLAIENVRYNDVRYNTNRKLRKYEKGV